MAKILVPEGGHYRKVPLYLNNLVLILFERYFAHMLKFHMHSYSHTELGDKHHAVLSQDKSTI